MFRKLWLIALVVALYVLPYVPLSAAGCYYPRSYLCDGGLQWCPIGTASGLRTLTPLGRAYYPLITLDRMLVHPSR